MSENKFIKHLKGEDTAKSVLEIKNQRTMTSFANMPTGTSNANDVYSDHRGNAIGVLKGPENWKVDGQNLVETTTVYGDGRDFSNSTYNASGNGLWLDASCTFATPKRFAPNTKFVLKLCGHDLETVINNTVDFTLIVKFGVSNLISKTFTVTEQAFNFCKEFVIDFAESNSAIIKVDAGSTMQVQLLCADSNARAVIYNGMTVFTALQRRVDADTVSSNTRTLDEFEEDFNDLSADFDQFVIDTNTALDGKVNIDGSSIMTAPLKFAAGSMRGAVGPYLNGVSFWKMSSQYTITNIANLTDSQFLPVTTNAIDLGRSANKWKDLYLGGKAYVATLNNGADLTVPNKTGTLATMADVEMAARSGRMLTDQGVWYAKMYSATVPPAADNGTNYADFSQVDGDNNPIIVIYERQSGAWVQTETITPPADYDGYVPITSKIWDIAEQAGQQGGRILWNHQSKEFTPYPTIISFEDIEVTGESTVIMPYSPSANQIVNKNYVDTLVSNSIGDATITLTQGGQTMGSFTTNQSGDATIALDGGSSYHPDLFDWKWADHQVNDVQWLRADTFSWQNGTTYSQAYQHLVSDISGVTPTTETVAGTTITFYLAADGHKIVDSTQESNVTAIYTATGVAWYYILDTVNQQFKLPRTKFGVTGLRDTVGNYVEAGLPPIGKIQHVMFLNSSQTDNDAITFNDEGRTGLSSGGGNEWIRTVDVGGGNSIFGNSTTVQPPATQMYLYFYVGSFTESAVENTAGLNAELFNDKADVSTVAHVVTDFQAPTAQNNYTWYRKYADGWVEQGGKTTQTATSSVDAIILFPVEMQNEEYTVTFSVCSSVAKDGAKSSVVAQTRVGITLHADSMSSTSGTKGFMWEVKGMVL